MKTSRTAARQNALALAGLRIAVGCLFLIFAEYKVFGMQFTRGGGFQYWINLFLQGGAYPFMVPVLRNFVLPHATPIAFLVAYGELAWELRTDDRVTVLERCNARALAPGDLPYRPELIAIDVSFISLSKVLPAVLRCAAERADRPETKAIFLPSIADNARGSHLQGIAGFRP